MERGPEGEKRIEGVSEDTRIVTINSFKKIIGHSKYRVPFLLLAKI